MAQDHYYSREVHSASQRQTITARLRDELWTFVTDRGVFSPDHVDPGSRLLIAAMEIRPGERVVDMGAGYGPVGLVAARLAGPDGGALLVEINPRAAQLCRENAQLNQVANVQVTETEGELPGPFDVVVTNPPVRAGKRVVFGMLERASAALAPGGRFYLVGNKHLGVNSYGRWLDEHVGPSEIVARGGGFRVLLAVKAAEGGDG
jgi:16S rRNA (guanine1207-N2)-methyltransferase